VAAADDDDGVHGGGLAEFWRWGEGGFLWKCPK
jgi:hypothetical protein